jgi:hypothetical protein
MGMFKWISPLDPARSYQTILRLFYREVLSEKIRSAQGNEVIEYRTKYAILGSDMDLYPFDSIMCDTEGSKSNKEAVSATSDQGGES